MLWFTLVGVLTLHHFGFEGRIFLEQNTMGPMFGLFKREREYLRFHASIIAYPVFIVKLWIWGEMSGASGDFSQFRMLLEQHINRCLKRFGRAVFSD